MLRLIWNGVKNIDKLTSMMFTRKNVILRALRALKLYGIVDFGSNTVRIVETPRNIALLIALNIAKPSDMLNVIFKALKETIGEDSEVKIENIEYTTPNTLRVRVKHSTNDISKLKTIERQLKDVGKELGFETVEVEFIKGLGVETLELNDEKIELEG